MCTTLALSSTSIAHILKQNALQGSVSSRAKTRSRANPPECSNLPPALLLRSDWVRKSREQLGHRCGEDVGGALAPCGGAVPAEKAFQSPSCDRHTEYVGVPGAPAARHAPFTQASQHRGHNSAANSTNKTLLCLSAMLNSGFGLIQQSTAVIKPEAKLSAPPRTERHSGSVWGFHNLAVVELISSFSDLFCVHVECMVVFRIKHQNDWTRRTKVPV